MEYVYIDVLAGAKRRLWYIYIYIYLYTYACMYVYIYIPMDPVVPFERKWDWGIIYYNLEAFWYLLRQCLDP